MNKLLCVTLTVLAACGGSSGNDFTRYEVCARIADAACTRATACEPSVNRTDCIDQAMMACCPDGTCDELVVADESRMAACESAIAAMSCSDLDDGDMPSACEHLDDPLPMDDDPFPPDDEPQPGTAVLEVTWDIYAGGTSLACSSFLGAKTLRLYATNPSGATITRDFTCDLRSALTNLPVGAYSVRADLRDASGAVIQQTTATTVSLSASGASASFAFTVTTRLGDYCVAMADQVCSTCAPNEPTCRTELVDTCCDDAGRCGAAALADPTEWDQCLTAWGSGQYCTGSASPSACSGVIDVY